MKRQGLGDIHIKPKNKGKFTRYCKNMGFESVTCECIQKGLESEDETTRKRANFALQFGREDCKR